MPTQYGGKGYTAKEMKEAFDKLPLFIIERFNMLLQDIESADEGSLISAIPTGISESHTIRDFFNDFLSGDAAQYLSVGDGSLSEIKFFFEDFIQRTEDRFGEIYSYMKDPVIDAGSPGERIRETGEFENE